jgi:DNA-binding SARP family transcriptional activator
MEFRILGPVRIHLGDQEDTVSGSKQRTMLACLLLAEGRAVSDEHLSRMLWGENPPSTAPAQIYTYASRIRQRIDATARLERIRTGYRLTVDDRTVDYRAFLVSVHRARAANAAGDHAQAALLLRAALGLWQGDALADTTEHLLSAEQPFLEEQRLEALELCIEMELRLHYQRGLIPELKSLVSRYPLRERLRALLMIALYRSEQQADAIALFQDCRRILDEELGVSPGRLLTQTYQGMLTGEVRSRLPQQLAAG